MGASNTKIHQPADCESSPFFGFSWCKKLESLTCIRLKWEKSFFVFSPPESKCERDNTTCFVGADLDGCTVCAYCIVIGSFAREVFCCHHSLAFTSLATKSVCMWLMKSGVERDPNDSLTSVVFWLAGI